MINGLESLQNYLVPASGTTHGYRFTQTMEADRIYELSFRNFQLNGRPFAPSGVLIDNTRGDADFSVIINEMSYRIVCKKGEFLHLPYPSPFQQTVSMQGEGLVTAIFVDYPVLPFSSLLTSSGGGGGGGSTGRSTMFHGFQGTALKSAAPAGAYSDLTVALAALDPDGWKVGSGLIIPAGVEKIRVGLMSMSVGGASREPCSWTIEGSGSVVTTGASAGQMDMLFVDFGVIDVIPDQPLTVQGQPDANATIGGTLVIEVVQGAILNT